jgi:hypothetical protein
LSWIQVTNQTLTPDKTVIATFIIDLEQHLWIADQRSEHVRCAAGQKVLSAGEMTFGIKGQNVEAIEVSNQSTGYCPEPESWDAVANALSATSILHPSSFTSAFLFRRCNACGSTNIIKDDLFECEVCQAPLSRKWNFAKTEI